MFTPGFFSEVRSAHVLRFICCVDVAFLFVFVPCLVCLMLPVSLECQFLVASSVFYKDYTKACLYIPISYKGMCSLQLNVKRGLASKVV